MRRQQSWKQKADKERRERACALPESELRLKKKELMLKYEALKFESQNIKKLINEDCDVEKISDLENKLSYARSSRRTRLSDLFFGDRPSDIELSIQKKIYALRGALIDRQREFSEKLRLAQSEIAKINDELRSISYALRNKNNERIAAQAAAYRGKVRAPANAVKKKEEHSSICPYCGKSADQFELDHIRPVAKGGLSDPANCVLVCIACNREKGMLLLRQFCKLKGWDFEKVAIRLELLGKEV